MNKMKRLGILATAIIVLGIIIAIVIYMNNWPLRFSKELNKFFGVGNWEYLSSEIDKTSLFSESARSANANTSTSVSGTYKKWKISANYNNQKKNWTLSNLTYKVNHAKHWFLSAERYSAKEAFILELMDISEDIALEKFQEEIINDLYSEKEAECFIIDLGYHGGNPEPNFYNELYKEDWFTADKVNAKDYLETDLYDFYLYIRIFDYKLEKLTEEEQQHLLATRENLEQRLLEEYGNNASFEIYFANGNKSEYKDGKKVEE